MACIKLPAPPPLPPITPTFGIPGFTPPRPTVGANLCCNFNLPTPPLPNLPGIPIPSVGLTIINAGIQSVNAYLAALDLVNVGCPLE